MMPSLPPFIYSMPNEKNAKAAIENYVQILQQAFEHYRNLWDDYLKLQKKYEQSNMHSPPSQVKADESCVKTKESTPQRDVNGCPFVRESDSVSLLDLKTVNTSYPVNSDTWASLSSAKYQLGDKDNNVPKSPVFSRSRLRINSTSAKNSPQLSKEERNKAMSDTKTRCNMEALFSKCDKKLDISTAHHVETTFLPDGKRLTQSRLVFPVKHERKVSSSNVKSVDTSLRAKQDPAKENLSTAKVSVTPESDLLNIDDTWEDVIEISPTQRNVKSKIKHRLALKRRTPVKQMKKKSPDKSRCHDAALIIIKDEDFELPFEDIPAETKNDGSVTTMTNALKTKVDVSNSSPVKMFNRTDVQITKSTEAQKKKPPDLINKASNTMLNLNDPVYEDETFYLPAEQAANKSNASDFRLLNDTENQPPAKKILLDKFNVPPKRKDVPQQLNMRCKADRAKLDGWDCWECKQYYENLTLSKEELQKRKNQCSRHRQKYEEPMTPEGFWDVGFPDTPSSTYR
ncbi:uncharacterized protein LOC105275240 isoform X2 [Ooceraea biroi]|uniref:DNA endonuclease RBBP8 n=1 Tax=Ooceraea biroi TaxID=2015173 RepID=A0A026X325_OOCBI|nr:uncharacterized protein LOC105275240 isoform X2 [Ooceraea biroi]EZA62426.1 DNA endonuclease RBBP8 [Ooceraea biroi]